jgi:hypothetical protein
MRERSPTSHAVEAAQEDNERNHHRVAIINVVTPGAGSATEAAAFPFPATPAMSDLADLGANPVDMTSATPLSRPTNVPENTKGKRSPPTCAAPASPARIHQLPHRNGLSRQ